MFTVTATQILLEPPRERRIDKAISVTASIDQAFDWFELWTTAPKVFEVTITDDAGKVIDCWRKFATGANVETMPPRAAAAVDHLYSAMCYAVEAATAVRNAAKGHEVAQYFHSRLVSIEQDVYAWRWSTQTHAGVTEFEAIIPFRDWLAGTYDNA
ncbi:MAG: hypothetical protein FJ038_12475 [Chloroflexi bacterium]|nr:hypothetical protein [Chloroflexota bacterium]